MRISLKYNIIGDKERVTGVSSSLHDAELNKDCRVWNKRIFKCNYCCACSKKFIYEDMVYIITFGYVTPSPNFDCCDHLWYIICNSCSKKNEINERLKKIKFMIDCCVICGKKTKDEDNECSYNIVFERNKKRYEHYHKYHKHIVTCKRCWYNSMDNILSCIRTINK